MPRRQFKIIAAAHARGTTIVTVLHCVVGLGSDFSRADAAHHHATAGLDYPTDRRHLLLLVQGARAEECSTTTRALRLLTRSFRCMFTYEPLSTETDKA